MVGGMRYAGTIVVVVGLGFAAGLTGCPMVPQGPGDAADTSDGEVFVPLSLARVVESLGEAEGGDRVTIFGAGLTAGAVVEFGGVGGTSVLVMDAVSLNVTTPPHAPGLVDVTVTLPDGQSAHLSDAFLYKGPIALTAILPTAGTTDGGGEVVVTGEGFVESTRIFFGTRMLEDQELVNATTIRGRVPARLRADPGFVDVIASSGFEQRVLEHAYEYTAILELLGLVPVSGHSAGGTLVTLRGTALDKDMGVWFGETPGEVVSVEADRQFAVVRAPPGVHGVVDVRAVRDGVTTVLAKAYHFVDPTVTGTGLWAGHVSPAQGSVAGGDLVAVSVHGMTNGAVDVTFDGVAAVVVDRRWGNDGNAEIVVQTPAHAAPGEVAVVVTQGGVSAATTLGTYAYVADFRVTAVNPALGAAATPVFVTIEGHGLRDASVWIGGKVAARRGSSERDVVVTAPVGTPGQVDIRVVAIDGRVLWLPAGYEYVSDQAKVWAVDPPTGSQAGGRIERLLGEGFRQGDLRPGTARFGTAECEELAIIDDGQAVCRVPRGDVGHVTVDAGALGEIAMAFGYFDPGTRFGGPAGGPMPEALNVTVLDAQTHKGVEEAFVILWDDLDTPYQGITDDRGQITFSEIGFGPMQMVTAAADNYSTASIVEFDARDVTLVLIPLIPAEPGNGNPDGPVLLGDSTVAGEVFGGDKYVLTPMGDCAARVGTVAVDGTSLCAPCATDDDCTGEGARCSPLGKQGWRCTTACETNDDCPSGFNCLGLPNSAVQCVPSPGRRTSRCAPTIPDVFSSSTDLMPPIVPMTYELTTHPGEFAIVCVGGFEDDVTGVFTPTAMGVRRHVFAQPDTVLDDQDVQLDIPLTRTLRIRLDGAPTGSLLTDMHRVSVFLDFGSDGVFLMPTQGEGKDQNIFELEGFPAAFAESLYDATFTVFATATSESAMVTESPASASEGSFVMFQPIAQVFSDAVFEIVASGTGEGGVARRQTGVDVAMHALAGPHGAGQAPTWLFAVGDEGRIMVWDGVVWGLQQAPTRVPLRGVWAAEKNDAWAVGDEATIVHWDGLRWLAVPGPASLARPDVAWWGVEGDGAGALWLWGSHGVWRRASDGTYADLTGTLTPGSVLAIRAFGPERAWWVGTGGLVREWRASPGGGVVTVADQPGGDLRAIDGTDADHLWVVGDYGRILRWDGRVWFELLPPTLRTLYAVQALGETSAWAAGDAGVVLRWDGARWAEHTAIEHSDLRGVAETGSGRTFTAGLATLVIGPFMQLPSAVNPSATGNLASLNLEWSLPRGADASFTWVAMLFETGFPFWDIVANGPRTNVPLPDLTAAWGLQPLWPSLNDGLQIVRVYKPGFDMGSWNYQVMSPYQWRSWSVRGVPMQIPE